jgi:hypothetical protein
MKTVLGESVAAHKSIDVRPIPDLHLISRTRRIACSEGSANTTDAVSKRTNVRNINGEFSENCGRRRYLMSLLVIGESFSDLLVGYFENGKTRSLFEQFRERRFSFVIEKDRSKHSA